MDDAGPSNWYNQHKDSTKDKGLDDPMDEDNFLIFIPNTNDTCSQLENLEGELYVLTLLEEEEIGRRHIHTCPYIGPMRVDYYLNTHEDAMFDKVRMHP